MSHGETLVETSFLVKISSPCLYMHIVDKTTKQSYTIIHNHSKTIKHNQKLSWTINYNPFTLHLLLIKTIRESSAPSCEISNHQPGFPVPFPMNRPEFLGPWNAPFACHAKDGRFAKRWWWILGFRRQETNSQEVYYRLFNIHHTYVYIYIYTYNIYIYIHVLYIYYI